MKTRIADENAEAVKLLPGNQPDGSEIGVNHAEAYIKPLNVELEDGRKVTCKRKGLKILLTIGDNKGEAIMRRIDHGPDVQHILRKALEAAAQEAGSEFTVDDGSMYLDL